MSWTILCLLEWMMTGKSLFLALLIIWGSIPGTSSLRLGWRLQLFLRMNCQPLFLRGSTRKGLGSLWPDIFCQFLIAGNMSIVHPHALFALMAREIQLKYTMRSSQKSHDQLPAWIKVPAMPTSFEILNLFLICYCTSAFLIIVYRCCSPPQDLRLFSKFLG